MSQPKLKYFVNLEPGNPTYHSEVKKIAGKTFVTRSEMKAFHGPTVKVNGSFFSIEKVHAEPQKKNTILESLIAVFFTWVLLYFIPGPDFHFSKFRWIVAISLSWLLGLLIGRLRISMQQTDADYFNKS